MVSSSQVAMELQLSVPWLSTAFFVQGKPHCIQGKPLSAVLEPFLLCAGSHGDEGMYDGEADQDDKDDGSQYHDDDTPGPSQGHDVEVQQLPETPSMRRLREQESMPLESPSKRLDALAGRNQSAKPTASMPTSAILS
jgi:hypothetical protein